MPTLDITGVTSAACDGPLSPLSTRTARKDGPWAGCQVGLASGFPAKDAGSIPARSTGGNT